MPGWIPYPYVRWNFKEDSVEYRPVLTVKIISNGIGIPLDGLVDSGCESCMIHIDLASALEIDLTKCTKIGIGGVGGKGTIGYLTMVKIRVDEFDHEFETPIIFADIPTQLLLGQSDFFKQFRVLFERDQARFQLSLVPKLE